MGLLEELPYEFPFPPDHHSDDQFATCSVSITYSYEGPAEKSDCHLVNFPVMFNLCHEETSNLHLVAGRTDEAYLIILILIHLILMADS